MKKIAWAYMVELDSGLEKNQTKELLDLIPEDIDVVPFTTDVKINGKHLLEANSIAYGFIDNEYFDELENVQKTMAKICNDWEKEREDNTYRVKGGFEIMMF